MFCRWRKSHVVLRGSRFLVASLSQDLGTVVEHVQKLEAQEELEQLKSAYQGEHYIIAKQLLIKWISSFRVPSLRIDESCALVFAKLDALELASSSQVNSSSVDGAIATLHIR